MDHMLVQLDLLLLPPRARHVGHHPAAEPAVYEKARGECVLESFHAHGLLSIDTPTIIIWLPTEPIRSQAVSTVDILLRATPDRAMSNIERLLEISVFS
jgi:hypothetical protein